MLLWDWLILMYCLYQEIIDYVWFMKNLRENVREIK